MSLRLIYGRAGSGKSCFCLDQIKKRLNDDDKGTSLILIVPEQFTMQAERNLVRAVEMGGIMRTEVLSFRRMAYRVFNEVGGITRKHVNAAGKCILIYRIMDEMKDELRIFSRAARQKGFVNTISDMIAEFKRYNVTPEMLGSLAGNMDKNTDWDTGRNMDGSIDGSLTGNSAGTMAGKADRNVDGDISQNGLQSGNDLLKDKLSELYLIYSAYEKQLHESYMDSDDDLVELCRRIDGYRRLDGAEIWIDEFSGFTPQEYCVIEKLLGRAARVNVCLCTDCLEIAPELDGCDVFSPVRVTAGKLIKLAQANHIPVEPPVRAEEFSNGLTRFTDSEELKHLENYFFSFPSRVYKEKTRDISLFAAANMYTEAEGTARDIIRLCRDRGLRYRDIAVVSGNLPGYEKLISSIFTAYDIPFFIDRKKNMDSHPLVVLILSVLDIFTSHWSYEPVFRYLKTGLTGIERESVDLLENYVLACGIRGNRWTQEESWDYRISPALMDGSVTGYEKSVLDRADAIRRQVAEPLMEFRRKTRGKRRVRDLCAALYEFLCDLGVPGRMEERVGYFREAGELNLANEYSQVWNIVMEVLDQAVEAMGNETAGPERFQKLLTIGFGEYSIGAIPPALDQVLVGSVDRSRSHDIKALYIIGVNDGVFPAAACPEGVLSDKEREELRSRGVELAQDTRTQAFEEQYMIYAAFTTAGKYLRLSYPAADHEGKAMRPSMIISRIRKLFPQMSEYSNIAAGGTGEDSLEMVSAPHPTFNELVCSLRRHAEGGGADPVWENVYRWYRSREEWENRCDTAISGLSYSNRVDSIAAGKVEKLYGKPVYTSISRLESYAACPFSYFVQYGLKAKERRVFRLSPPDVGVFMHKVIDLFSKRLEEKKMDWRTIDREWCGSEVSDIVEELLQNTSGLVLNSSERYRYLSGRLKRVLTRAIWLIAEHINRGGFSPLGYEIIFGEGGDFPPITIELPSGEKIHLTGRIDRVDALKTEEGSYLRIIDYKSGNKAFKLADVYYGLQIQLIVYMDAMLGAEKGLPVGLSEPVLPGGILYFRIDDPVIRADGGMTDEEVEKAIMRQLKMKGLLLADVKLIREMDRQMEGDSLIIPARINKGDVLGRSSAASMEQFNLLRRYVSSLLAGLGEEMLKGNVAIAPYKKRNVTSCMYCRFLAVCQFDPLVKGNRYRLLNDTKDEEVWERMKAADKTSMEGLSRPMQDGSKDEYDMDNKLG